MVRELMRVLLIGGEAEEGRTIRETLAGESERGMTATRVRLEEACSLAEALARFGDPEGRGTFDVVLLDLSVPDGNGLEAVRRVRALAPTLPLVVMVPPGGERLAAEAMQAGALECVVKGRVRGKSLLFILRCAVGRQQLLASLKRNREEERVKKLEDPATGLPDYQGFCKALKRLFEETAWRQERMAILLVGCEGLEEVRLTLGRDGEERVLAAVARHLLACTRKDDLVARVGPHRFAVLLKNVFLLHNVAKVAEKILGALSRAHPLDGRDVRVPAGVGIAVYPSDADEVMGLMRRAEAALDEAVLDGGGFRFYGPFAGRPVRAVAGDVNPERRDHHVEVA